MSNFNCPKCNTAIIDSAGGPYITGCEHYPMETTQNYAPKSKPMQTGTQLKCPVCGGEYCEGEICSTNNVYKINETRKLSDCKRMCLCGDKVTPDLQAKIDNSWAACSANCQCHPTPKKGRKSQSCVCCESLEIPAKEGDMMFELQPIGGVSENKPSTGEDWEKELETFDYPTAWRLVPETKKEQHHEKCSWRQMQLLCDCVGVDMARLARNDLKPFIRSLLQKERERCVSIIGSFQDHWQKYGYPIEGKQEYFDRLILKLKQQILKDNQ